ncbi:hypothetical protein BASA83_012316 [Batrachochytrium salamandrivorans]|nr:hypothetical protein BASA83_012316 [Batrachochytrium salamandrivorans]
MFDPLLWVLHHFITHYAGQTTQGNKDGVNGVNGEDQVSGSKNTANLLHITTLINPYTALQEGDAPSQSDASLSADLKPGKECKGGHGIRKYPSHVHSSNHHQDHSHPLRMITPNPMKCRFLLYFRVGTFQYYTYFRKTKQYPGFTKEEARYFASEYSFKKKLGQGKYGVVSLATRKSNGMEVAYKSIPKSNSFRGAISRTYMSSRPPNPLVPYEFLLQKYLSRLGHENTYVPMVLDYIILKDKFILVMEYIGESWVSLLSYLMKKIRLDVSEARDIIREIVKAMIYLKQHGIVHEDLHVGNVMYNPETQQVKLIDFGKSAILPGWKAGKSFPLKSSDPPSPVLKYKAGIKEMKSMQMLGRLLYSILTGTSSRIDYSDYEAIIRSADTSTLH